MGADQPKHDAIKTAGDLTGALNAVRSELIRLNAFGNRSRHLIRLTIVSLLLDVILTVSVATLAYQAHRAAVTVTQLHSAQVSACELSNQSRAQEILLWTHLAAVSSAPPHLSKAALAANRRKIAALLAYIRKTFASRDCARLYRLP